MTTLTECATAVSRNNIWSVASNDKNDAFMSCHQVISHFFRQWRPRPMTSNHFLWNIVFVEPATPGVQPFQWRSHNRNLSSMITGGVVIHRVWIRVRVRVGLRVRLRVEKNKKYGGGEANLASQCINYKYID